MATFLPVLFLAGCPTVARAAAAAFLAQGKPKLGGADGALREDHIITRACARVFGALGFVGLFLGCLWQRSLVSGKASPHLNAAAGLPPDRDGLGHRPRPR